MAHSPLITPMDDSPEAKVQASAVHEAAVAMSSFGQQDEPSPVPPIPPPGIVEAPKLLPKLARFALVLVLPLACIVGLTVLLFALLPLEARSVLAGALLLSLLCAASFIAGVWMGERRRRGVPAIPAPDFEKLQRFLETGVYNEPLKDAPEPYKGWEA